MMNTWFQTGKGVVSYLVETVSPHSSHQQQSSTPSVKSTKKRKRSHDAPVVLFTTLNQDNRAVCCGTSKGFAIFRCKPFEEIFSWTKLMVLKGAMFYDKSLLAVLTRNTTSKYSKYTKPSKRGLKVSLFDTKTQSEFWSVECRHRRLRHIHFALTRRRLIVTLKENSLSLFDLSDSMSPLHPDIATYDDCGIFDVCNHSDHGLIAFPDPSGEGRIAVLDAFNLQKRIVFQAHDSPIQVIKFNANGSYIASASIYGTLIRIFSVEKRPNRDLCIATFRRGTFNTEIACLAFNPSSTRLVCSSMKSDTVHIFNVEEAVQSRMKWHHHHSQRTVSMSNLVADYLSISSHRGMESRSAIHIEIKCSRINKEEDEDEGNVNGVDVLSPMQCGFIDDDSVMICTANGYLYRYILTTENKAMLISEHCLCRNGTDYPETKIFKVEEDKVEDEESSYLNDDPDQIPSPPESPTLSDMGCEGLIGGDAESWDLNDSEDNNVFKNDTV